MPRWEIVYFQSARGEKFVKSFIDIRYHICYIQNHEDAEKIDQI